MDEGRRLPDFQACNWTTTPLSFGWPSYTIVHYTSNSAYSKFAGFDLTGHNHDKYERSQWYWPLLNRTKIQNDVNLSVSFCKEDEADGSTWHVQRIGPLVSRGGYDWWQMSAFDVGSLSNVLETRGHIALVENYMGAVTASGRGIGYPPIHVHHIHVVPTKGVLRFQREDRLYSPNYVFEHHGDSSWCNVSGVSDACHTRQTRQGFGKFISSPLDLDCELNDVRKEGPSFTWYLQFAFRWTRAKNLKPLSLINVIGKVFITPGRQETYEGTFLVRARGRHVSVYSGRWPSTINGDVIQVRTHNHLTILEKGFLFQGQLCDLSSLLAVKMEEAARRGETLPLQMLGHVAFGPLEKHLMQSAASRLLCTVVPTLLSVDNVLYDHMPQVACRSWRLTESTAFTSISFLDMHATARILPPWLDAISDGRMHTHWIIEYVRIQPCSCYSLMKSLPGADPFSSQTNCTCLDRFTRDNSHPSDENTLIGLHTLSLASLLFVFLLWASVSTKFILL